MGEMINGKQFIVIGISGMIFLSCNNNKENIEFNPKAVDLNNRAVEMLKRYEIDSAMVLLDSAIAADNNYYYPHSNKSAVYISRKQYDKAIKESELVLQKSPESAESWAFAGMIYDRIGKQSVAYKYYQNSIKLYNERIDDTSKMSQKFDNRLNRAMSLILIGKESDAKGELQKLKAEQPDNFLIDELMTINKEEYMNQMLGTK